MDKLICENCELDSEINCLGRYLIDKNLGTKFFDIQNSYLQSGRQICSSCGSELSSKEYFYENEIELFNKLGRITAESFSDLSLYDGSDEDNLSYDIGEYFSEPGEHPEVLQNTVGSPMSIGDLIDERLDFIPCILTYIEPAILSYLNENILGIDLDHEAPADNNTDVLTAESKDFTNRNFYGLNTDEITSAIDDLVSYVYTISDEQLTRLKKDEINDRYLDHNETYKKLRDVFLGLYNHNYGVTVNDKKLYRARLMDNSGIKRLKKCEKELLKNQALTPPVGVPSQGRWNFGGKPTTLYASDKCNQLPRELEEASSDKKVVIFNLETNKPRCLMPISLLARQSKLYSMLTEPVNKKDSKKYKQQYVLSNLIGKIILNSHYDGIIYDPTIYKDSDSKYNDQPMNYAIFNSDVNNLDCFNDITVNGFFCL